MLKLLPITAIAVFALGVGGWISHAEHQCEPIPPRPGQGPISFLAAGNSAAPLIYAVTENGTLYASKSGRRWTRRVARAPGHEILSLGETPDVLFSEVQTSRSSEGLFRSADGGRSWHRISCWTVSSLAADPTSPGTVYIGTFTSLSTGRGGGLYRTEDGGAHWRRFSGSAKVTALNTRDVNLVAVDPSNGDVYVGHEFGGLQVSSDGGEHWRFDPIKRGLLGLDGPQVTAVSFGNGPDRVIWAGSRLDGLYRRTARSSRWVYVGFKGSTIYDVVASPRLDDSAVVASEDQLLHTEDGGETWQLITELPPGSVGFAAPAGDGALYAWHRRTIYRSRDGGRTWRPLAPLPS